MVLVIQQLCVCINYCEGLISIKLLQNMFQFTLHIYLLTYLLTHIILSYSYPQARNLGYLIKFFDDYHGTCVNSLLEIVAEICCLAQNKLHGNKT